ncbi:MAG: glycosyltransferase [Pseudomonadota bacterium]
MEISLIISTLGRSEECVKLLDSLLIQTYPAKEVIFIDQNKEDILDPILERYRDRLNLNHVRTPNDRGLSRGRNAGLQYATGEIVLFPDDDCWYPADCFEKAIALLMQNNADIVTGRAADETGRSINGRFLTSPQMIDRSNVWTTQIEWMVFFKRELLLDVGGYDVNIGVGAASPWQACEGQDIVLRSLTLGATAFFSPALIGHHAELPTQSPDKTMRTKGRLYAQGFGYVAGRHNYPVSELAYFLFRSFAGAIVSAAKLNLPRALYFFEIMMGRLYGYRNGRAQRLSNSV